MPRKKKGTPARDAAEAFVDGLLKAPPPETKRTNQYQEKPPADKPKRASVEVHCACKRCAAPLVVKVFRNIVTPAVPAEVELETVVEIDAQLKLDLGVEEPGAGQAMVEIDGAEISESAKPTEPVGKKRKPRKMKDVSPLRK